jgi:hypothetical protein
VLALAGCSVLLEPDVLYADAGSAALLPHRELPPGSERDGAEIVDQYFAQYWRENGVSPAPLIDDATFLRRASLALLGISAQTHEVRSFLSESSPEKRRAKVNEWLEHSRYADYWGFRLRQWITDLREVEGQGSNTFTLYRYTREAMAENRPWDRIASDLLDSQGNMVYDGNANFGVYLSGAPNEMAEGAGRLFLGVKISCAQCHDDPFQGAWTQQTYWSFAAFYGRTKMIQMNEGGPKFDRLFPNLGRSESSVSTLPGGDAAIDGEGGEKRAIIDRTEGEVYLGGKSRRDKDRGPALVPTPLDGEPMADIDQLDMTRRQAFVRWMTSPENKQFARSAVNRFFHELTGRCFVPSVEGFGPDVEIQHEPLLDRLADQFVKEKYDVKWLLRTIVNSRMFQSAAGSAAGDDREARNHWNCFVVRPLNSDQWHDSVLRASGREARIEELGLSAATSLALERNERLAGRISSLNKARKVLVESGEARRASELPGASGVAAPVPVEADEKQRRASQSQREKYRQLGEKLRRTRDLARSQMGPTGSSLMQMNGRLVTEALRETDVPKEISELPSPEQRLDRVYLQVLGRLPNPAERQRLAPALSEANPRTVADLMWALMQSTEFLTY